MKNDKILCAIFTLLIVNFFIVQASQELENIALQKKLTEALIEINASRSDSDRRNQGKKKMEQVIKNGADVNQFIHINSTTTWLPLTYAVVNADLGTCRLLIECKANINGEDELGITPLMMSLLFLRPDKVQLLLEYSADFTKKNSEGESAWDCIKEKEIHFFQQEKRRKSIIDLIRNLEQKISKSKKKS